MLIREAKYEERDILNKLFQNLLEHERDNYDDWISESVTIDSYFDKHLKFDNEIVLVAEIENEIVGYIHCVIEDNKILKEAKALINSLFVKEEYRNNHIGKSLVEAMFSKLLERNIHNVEIENILKNNQASHLYESLGFKVFKENRRIKL